MTYRNVPSGKCAQFDAFVKKICRNECRNAVRTIKRRLAKEELVAEPKPVNSANSEQDSYPSVSDNIRIGRFAFVIKRPYLYAALMRLDEKERYTILLYFWEDMRDWEIGKILGMSQQAVQYRRTKGMASLKEVILAHKRKTE